MLPRDGDEISGQIRVDSVADGVVRVRYSEGPVVPANRTPMLVGNPLGEWAAEVRTSDDALEIDTGEVALRVRTHPFTLRAHAPDGRVAFEIGGEDKNLP